MEMSCTALFQMWPKAGYWFLDVYFLKFIALVVNIPTAGSLDSGLVWSV